MNRSLMQSLPEQIQKLEAKYGSENPYVTMLKQQLQDMENQKAEPTQQRWVSQAQKRPNTP